MWGVKKRVEGKMTVGFCLEILLVYPKMWNTGKIIFFLNMYVKTKESMGMQVKTQITQKNGCGFGRYQFL